MKHTVMIYFYFSSGSLWGFFPKKSGNIFQNYYVKKALLLSKFIVYLDIISFYLMSSFSSKISSRILHYIPLLCFIIFLLAVSVSQTVLDFGDLDCFWGVLVKYFTGDPSGGICLIFVSCFTLGLWGFRSIKCLSCCSIVDVNLEHLAGVVFVSLPLYEITPPRPLFIQCSFKGSPHMRSGKLCSSCLKKEGPYKLLGVLLLRQFVYSLPFTYLFNNLFIWIWA